MGAIADAFRAAFRDFNTDGSSGTGNHSPVKADLRALGTLIETGLGPPASFSWDALGAAVATMAALPACTYANGTAGVGATLTGNSNGALAAIDGVTPTTNMRILVMNQAAALQNGLYQVTQVGDGSHPFILTRATDANTPALLGLMGIAITGGTVNAGRQFVLQILASNITIGTTALVFALYLVPTGYAPGLSPYTSDNATDAAIVFDGAKMLAEEIRGDAYENNLAVGPRTLAAWSAQLASQAVGPMARVGEVKTNAILAQLASIATHAVPKAGASTTISSTGAATQICIGLVGETLFALWNEVVAGRSKIYYSTWALHGGTPSAGAALIDLSALTLDVSMGAVKVDTDGKTIHIFAFIFGSGYELVYHYSSVNLLATLSQPHFIAGGSGSAGMAQAGRAVQLDDGTLLISTYTSGGTFNSYLYASVDQGVSWLQRSTIGTGSAYTDGNSRNETSLLLNRATKELVAVVRSNADGGTGVPVYIFRSQDFGVTWDGGTASSFNGKGQPWIEDIGGGALAYFDRGVTQTQLVCRISLDFGRNFGNQIVLDTAGGGNSGYLTAVPVGNRTIQVAYQLNGNVVTRQLTFDPQINEGWSPAPVSISNCTIGAVTGAKYRRNGDSVRGSFAVAVTGVTAGAASFSFTLPETSSDSSAPAPNVGGCARDATGVYGPGIVFSSGTTGKVTITLPTGASTVIVNFEYDL